MWSWPPKPFPSFIKQQFYSEVLTKRVGTEFGNSEL